MGAGTASEGGTRKRKAAAWSECPGEPEKTVVAEAEAWQQVGELVKCKILYIYG